MEWIVYVSAIWAALATTWAAHATVKLKQATIDAPINAAKVASQLQDESEKRRLKMWVFGTIMQNRRYLGEVDCVKAINLIDTVFCDDIEVRDAWANLHATLLDERTFPKNGPTLPVLDDRRNALLSSMAKALGLALKFRPDDFARIYFPKGMDTEYTIRNMQQDLTLKNLSEQLAVVKKEEDVVKRDL